VDCLDKAASKVKRSTKADFAGIGAPIIDSRQVPANCPADLIISFDVGKGAGSEEIHQRGDGAK